MGTNVMMSSIHYWRHLCTCTCWDCMHDWVLVPILFGPQCTFRTRLLLQQLSASKNEYQTISTAQPRFGAAAFEWTASAMTTTVAIDDDTPCCAGAQWQTSETETPRAGSNGRSHIVVASSFQCLTLLRIGCLEQTGCIIKTQGNRLKPIASGRP